MKMWTSPKLSQAYDADWCRQRRHKDYENWWICGRWVRRRFDLPKGTRHIWITVGLQPSADRIAVVFKRDPQPLSGKIEHLGRVQGSSRWQVLFDDFDQALADHFGPRLTSGPLYLGLLYEE